jgi:heavy metal translocating P-type ATPase
LFLSAPVVLLLGVPLAKRAFRGLAAGRIGMDLLVLVGATAAFVISLRALFQQRHGIYFDSATAALMLATLGRFLEAQGRAQASRLLGPLLERTRASVRVRRGETLEPTAPALIAAEDELFLDVDETLPVDARVLGDTVEVNLAVLTGEPTPVARHAGETVPAGAVVVAGSLRGVALRSAKASTLERLAELSRTLREQPSQLVRLADGFATVLTPLVFLVAGATFLHWNANGSMEEATLAALSVVLAACPCTYGAIAPLVQWLAMRKALEHGVLVHRASTLEELATVERVAFDKTGTLTDALLAVRGIELAEGVDESEALGLVAALEAGSRHPVGRALAAFAHARGAVAVPLSRRALVVGAGVEGLDATERRVRLGAASWALGSDAARPPDRLAARVARVALACDGRALAWLDVGEALRSEAAEAVSALRAVGVGAVILTGDEAGSAKAIGESLGVEVRAGLGPEAKLAAIRALGPRTSMVGDGLNDGPALAGVGPGFAMEGGTDLARGMAQVTLLEPDLRLVPWTLALARHAARTARRGLYVATAYNVVFLSLAAAGLLRPVWAGVAMATSSVLMLAGALRVRVFPAPGEVSP